MQQERAKAVPGACLQHRVTVPLCQALELDQHRVRPKEAKITQLHGGDGPGERTGMDGDRQTQRLGSVELLAPDRLLCVLRSTRDQPEGQPTLTGATIGRKGPLDPLDVVERHDLVVGHRVWPAVREAGPQTALVQRGDLRVGVLRRDHVVGEVVDRGDPGIERLEHRHPDGCVEVGSRVIRGKLVLDREIPALDVDQVAIDRVPQVPVRLHEAGQHEHAGTVDDRRRTRVQMRPDADDLAVSDMDIADLERADQRVHRHDQSAADDEFAALGKCRHRSLPPRSSVPIIRGAGSG